jgi:hypothetical protein
MSSTTQSAWQIPSKKIMESETDKETNFNEEELQSNLLITFGDLLRSLIDEPSIGSVIIGIFKTMINKPSFIDDEEIKELLKIILKNKSYKSILLKLLKEDSTIGTAKTKTISEETVSEETVLEVKHKILTDVSTLETERFTKVIKPKIIKKPITLHEIEPVQYNRYETKIIDPFIIDEQNKFFNSIFKELFDGGDESKYNDICYRTQHDLSRNNIWAQIKKDLSGNKDLVKRQGLKPFSRVTCIENRMAIFNNILYEKCASYMRDHFDDINEKALLHASVYNEGDGRYIISFKTYGHSR